MKFNFIILICVLFYSCVNKNEQTANIIKTSIQTETRKDKQNNYENVFYKTAQKSKNLDIYINKIVKDIGYIYKISYDPNTQTLNYFVLEDKDFPNKDFYALSKTLEFDWTYFLFNDIYKASFRYKKVKRVSLFDVTNKKNITYLPAKSDVLYLIKGSVFDSDIYVNDLDYNSLNLDCDSSESENCTVTKKNIQKELQNKSKR